MPKKDHPFDEIGYWSEVKLDIVKEYATAYSTILSAQSSPPLHHLYIDAFAGAGLSISRSTGAFVLGSPLNALNVDPPFREYHFIDLSAGKLGALREFTSGVANTHIHEGDCNELLLKTVFPRARYENYRRALCLLDPYGLHLNWDVIQAAGRSKAIDMFLNFPVMDMNRNVLWRNSEAAPQPQCERMTAFWGDDTWRTAAYSQQGNLFGYDEKEDNDEIAAAFQDRLKQVAGFKNVPSPLPMRNTRGAVVYYLFFASQKPVAEHIVKQIFAKYSTRGARHGNKDRD